MLISQIGIAMRFRTINRQRKTTGNGCNKFHSLLKSANAMCCITTYEWTEAVLKLSERSLVGLFQIKQNPSKKIYEYKYETTLIQNTF